MKYVISILALSLLFPAKNYSQWQILNSKPSSDDIFVVYADSQNCRAVTMKADLALSTNGGDTWEYHTTNIK